MQMIKVQKNQKPINGVAPSRPARPQDPGRWIPAIIRQGNPDDSILWLTVRLDHVSADGRVLWSRYLECGPEALFDQERFAVLALTEIGAVIAWHSPADWRFALSRAVEAFNPETGL